MESLGLWEGIIVGAAGGAFAGITVKLIGWITDQCRVMRDKNKVYNWLCVHTSVENGNRYRSTRAIASWNNLTEDRVRYICSEDERIHLSTGENEDRWSVHSREP